MLWLVLCFIAIVWLLVFMDLCVLIHGAYRLAGGRAGDVG